MVEGLFVSQRHLLVSVSFVSLDTRSADWRVCTGARGTPSYVVHVHGKEEGQQNERSRRLVGAFYPANKARCV